MGPGANSPGQAGGGRRARPASRKSQKVEECKAPAALFHSLSARRRVLLARAEPPENIEQVGLGCGVVRLDLQGLPVVFARLGQPAPVSERSTPDDVDFGRLRLDLQRLPVMVVRLGGLALLSERQAPVGVGVGIIRL